MKMLLRVLGCTTLCLFGCGGGSSLAPDPEIPVNPGIPESLRADLLSGADVTISSTEPRFSWTQPSDDRSMQSAYRILVGSADPLTAANADLWDSGIVRSSDSQGVRYAGRTLTVGVRYRWAVQVWNAEGGSSSLSAPQEFTLSGAADPLPPRRPLVTQLVAPASVTQLSPGHLFVVFPAAAYGTLVLDFPTAHAAGAFDVFLGEHHVGNAVWRSAADGFTSEISLVAHAGQIVSSGAAGRVRLLLPARTVAGAVPLPAGFADIVPFRYVEIRGDAAALGTARIFQEAVNYPFDDAAASFTSSDAVLNDVWKLSHHTMKATSAFGLFVDGNRERLPYEADAYINQLGHYNAVADYSLARYTNAYLLRVPSWPTEWVLHDHLLAWADYEYTGDDAYLRANYERLQKFLLLPLARADGLISTRTGLVTPDYRASLGMELGPDDIVDWPQAERDGYDMSVTYNTVVNLFHFRALSIMSEIARVTGHQVDSDTYAARAQQVRDAILATFFDSQRGVFVDGEGSSHASLHANMFALAFGVVPDGRRASVLEFVKSRGMACSVYGAQYLLEALYANREAEPALALLNARGPRSWSHMIYDLDATIAHEAWDPSNKPNEDWNHAWGAAPANVIPRWMMGVRPLTPGFATFLVAPQTGSLQHAELRLPGPRGTIDVRVVGGTGLEPSIDLVVPGNSMAFVEPGCRSGTAAIWVDGRKTLSPAGTGSRVGPLGPGSHEIECRTS